MKRKRGQEEHAKEEEFAEKLCLLPDWTMAKYWFNRRVPTGACANTQLFNLEANLPLEFEVVFPINFHFRIFDPIKNLKEIKRKSLIGF